MKWTKKIPRHGDIRTIKKFLFLPKTIRMKDVLETRWLETVWIKQEYINISMYVKWEDVAFVDSSGLSPYGDGFECL